LREHLALSNKGITLIELLIALVIGATIVAGIYRVFIAQTRAYTVQDQVVEVQQNIRSAMEILLRDIRMAGYDGSQTPSRLLTAVFPGDSTIPNVSNDAITVQYRVSGNLNTKVIYRNAATAQLMENLFVNGVQDPNYPVVLLDNVNALTFTYGVDGRIDLPETQDGTIDAGGFILAATVNAGNLNPIAVRVVLTAGPSPVDPDIPKMVQPRTLISAITVRNLCLVRTN
jgi:prepilin-type N-terminal cleavage/methylation domain-containing protein